MHGHVLEPRVDHESEQQAEAADEEAAEEKRAALDAEEFDLTEIRDDEVRFAARLAGLRDGSRDRGCSD